jgi:hypothetical protein
LDRQGFRIGDATEMEEVDVHRSITVAADSTFESLVPVRVVYMRPFRRR